MWKIYTVYVDKLVLDGFHTIVQTSLNYLLKETDTKTSPDPLFEAQLKLDPPEILFSPSPGGFLEQIQGLISNIYEQSSLIPRIAKHLGQDDYQVNNQN